MPKLYFRYGTMGSSKTANLLMVAHNYEQQGKEIIIIKPSIDNRDGIKNVSSRTGLHRKADIILDKKTNLLVEVTKITEEKNINCILVDEAQFLTKLNVEELRFLTNKIPVICYGLRTNYLTNTFEGSLRLLELADSIEEIKTTCFYCNNKAIINAKYYTRVNSNYTVIVKKGSSLPEIGGDELYLSMCWRCWNEHPTS